MRGLVVQSYGMGTVRNFKAGRGVPTPDERSSWNFRLWSYGFMRPLHCIPKTITLSNAPQSILDVYIPANMWAKFNHMLVRAEVQILRHAPIPVGNTVYKEGYTMSTFGNVQRGANQNITATSLSTLYQIERDFILDTVSQPHECNFDTVGIASYANVQGGNHFLDLLPPFSTFNPSLAYMLSFTIWNTDPTTADTATIGSAQAYIQAPLNLNRLPQ
jgi:hypothetical protein